MGLLLHTHTHKGRSIVCGCVCFSALCKNSLWLVCDSVQLTSLVGERRQWNNTLLLGLLFSTTRTRTQAGFHHLRSLYVDLYQFTLTKRKPYFPNPISYLKTKIKLNLYPEILIYSLYKTWFCIKNYFVPTMWPCKQIYNPTTWVMQ